jgi:hypothetical protein
MRWAAVLGFSGGQRAYLKALVERVNTITAGHPARIVPNGVLLRRNHLGYYVETNFCCNALAPPDGGQFAKSSE